MWLALLGISIATAGAYALARLMAKLLYDIRTRDPATNAGLIVLLLATTLLASWIPARRAQRVDPAMALRTE